MLLCLQTAAMLAIAILLMTAVTADRGSRGETAPDRGFSCLPACCAQADDKYCHALTQHILWTSTYTLAKDAIFLQLCISLGCEVTTQ